MSGDVHVRLREGLGERFPGATRLTIVYNLVSGDLVWMTEGRRAAGLIDFFVQLDEPVAQGIEAVAMAMWKPFESAVRESLPNAAIVFDHFHVMQQYSKAIDAVPPSRIQARAQG